MIRTHKILCFAENVSQARENVETFFQKSMLIHYDTVQTIAELSSSAHDDRFWREVDESVNRNRQVLLGYLSELKETGCQTVDDCANLDHGYPSKLFHIVAHLLDGFIGIDSAFYCLPEDSHWLSERLREQVAATPETYFLIHTEGHFSAAEDASLIHM